MKIQNDEQYQKALDYLVSEARELANPLYSGMEKERRKALYDRATEHVREYSKKVMCDEFPYWKKHMEPEEKSALDAWLE